MDQNVLSLEGIRHDLVIIRINQLYRSNMSAKELYEVTRGTWKISREKVKDARYALAYSEGDIVEVYLIEEWLPAGSVPMETRPVNKLRIRNCLEFKGRVAESDIRDYYLGKDASSLFSYGEGIPVKVFYAGGR